MKFYLAAMGRSEDSGEVNGFFSIRKNKGSEDEVSCKLKILLMVQKSGIHQLRLVVYPSIYEGFFTSQVVDYLYDRRYFYIIRCMYGAFFLKKF